MGLSLILFILAGVLITSILSGIIGMLGDALLLVILSLALLPIQQTALLYAASLFFACASRAFIHRKQLYILSMEYYLVGLLFAVFIFGPLPGIAIDKGAQDLLRGVGQAVLGVAFFLPFFSRGKIKLDFTRRPQALLCAVMTAGFKSLDNRGFLLNLFFQDILMTRYEVISTKAAAQLIPCIMLLWHSGSAMSADPGMPQELPLVCFAIAIAAFVGSYLGKRILQKMTDIQFYKTTQIVLWIMGALYLWEASSLIAQALPELQAVRKT
jgi:uncharacterized membrane protein YfcA